MIRSKTIPTAPADPAVAIDVDEEGGFSAVVEVGEGTTWVQLVGEPWGDGRPKVVLTRELLYLPVQALEARPLDGSLYRAAPAASIALNLHSPLCSLSSSTPSAPSLSLS